MLNDDFALPRPAALAGLLQALGNGALVRVTLLINHVIAAEPAAMRRLAGQAGKPAVVLDAAAKQFIQIADSGKPVETLHGAARCRCRNME